MNILSSLQKPSSQQALKEGLKKTAAIIAVIVALAAIVFGAYAAAKGPLFWNPASSYSILAGGIILGIGLLILFRKEIIARVSNVAQKNEQVKKEIDSIAAGVKHSRSGYDRHSETLMLRSGYRHTPFYQTNLMRTNAGWVQRHAKRAVDNATVKGIEVCLIADGAIQADGSGHILIKLLGLIQA